MTTKEESSQLQTTRPEKFDIEYLKKITEDFSAKRIIGRGGFGIVYKGTHKRKFIAVKKLFIKPDTVQIDDEKFENELINVMRISHPNIVRLVGYCSTIEKEAIRYQGKPVLAENHYRLICFEYLRRGSLDEHLKDKCHVDWNERYNIIKGICRGLHYLHCQHILHLDLKPANVLLDEGMIPKIADFGLSRLWLPIEGQIHTKNIKGTPGYMPIEYIEQGTISKKTDIYSLGVIVMEIMAGVRKYRADQLDEVRRKWEETPGLSSEEREEINKCIELALDCMAKEPEKRPYMEQVIMILGISEDDMNHHPDGIEEHCVINIDSSEVDPSLEERHGLLRRRTMTADKKISPPETLESSKTAVTARTKLQRMMNWAPLVCGVPVPLPLLVVGAVAFYCFVLLPLLYYTISSYEMSKTVFSITVEEASFTRFALLATSSPVVLTYCLSAMVMGIDSPSFFYLQTVTKPLEATFFFGGQRLYVVRLRDKGEYMVTTVVSDGPLSGNVTLDTAGVAEYRKQETSTSTGPLYEVEMVVVGQVMYDDEHFTICNMQATCPFKLRLAPPDGTSTTTTELELSQKVKCTLHRKCSSYQI